MEIKFFSITQMYRGTEREIESDRERERTEGDFGSSGALDTRD